MCWVVYFVNWKKVFLFHQQASEHASCLYHRPPQRRQFPQPAAGILLWPPEARHHGPTGVFRRSKHTQVDVAADRSPPQGSWPIIWQRLTIAGEESEFQGQTDGQTKWLWIRTTLPAHVGGLCFWLSGHHVFRLSEKTQRKSGIKERASWGSGRLL